MPIPYSLRVFQTVILQASVHRSIRIQGGQFDEKNGFFFRCNGVAYYPMHVTFKSLLPPSAKMLSTGKRWTSELNFQIRFPGCIVLQKRWVHKYPLRWFTFGVTAMSNAPGSLWQSRLRAGGPTAPRPFNLMRLARGGWMSWIHRAIYWKRLILK